MYLRKHLIFKNDAMTYTFAESDKIKLEDLCQST